MSESEFGCAERVPARGLESADSNWNRRAAEAVRKLQLFVTATLSYGIGRDPGDRGGFDSAAGVSRDQ
jgi:hypothetical protein